MEELPVGLLAGEKFLKEQVWQDVSRDKVNYADLYGAGPSAWSPRT